MAPSLVEFVPSAHEVAAPDAICARLRAEAREINRQGVMRWRAKNRERYLAGRRAFYSTEKRAEYYREHKAREEETRAAWLAANADRVREVNKAYKDRKKG